MASPSVPGEDLVISQMKVLLKSKGVSKEIINKKLRLERKLINSLKQGDDLNKYKNELFTSALEDINLNSNKKNNSESKDSLLAKQIVAGQLNMLSNPWTKFFFTFNPNETIENITCPVLILFGEKDMQVPSKLNIEPFRDALQSKGNYKVVVFPDANHLFQFSITGLPSEYKSLDKKFVLNFIPTIINWLDENIK